MAAPRQKSATSPAALRRQRLVAIDRAQISLLRQIDDVYLSLLDQIEAAYSARLRPRMTRRDRAALDAEYNRQSALADQERERQIILTNSEHARQSAMAEAEYAMSRPTPRRVSHAKTVSRFWKHFASDGRPVSPWEISVGPGLDVDEGVTGASIWDEPLFAEPEYSYEDFDTDWGLYEVQDSGDSNAEF